MTIIIIYIISYIIYIIYVWVGRFGCGLGRFESPHGYNLHLATGLARSIAREFEAAATCFAKAVRLKPCSCEARIHRAIDLVAAAQASDSTKTPAYTTAQAATATTAQ